MGNAGQRSGELKFKTKDMYSKKIDTISLSKTVLIRLSAMDYENHKENHKENNGSSIEQLIFPMKIEKKGNNLVDRISEQELRLLFIEEFKKAYSAFFYSIETPTKLKYSFEKKHKNIISNSDGQSALIDMCIFERINNEYQRILNIEFKYKNTAYKNIEKDILKLISENNNGVFIHLLHNTDRGTFCKKGETGIFDKFRKSFSDFQKKWNDEDKFIQLIIISLKQKALIHRVLKKNDLKNLNNIFFTKSDCGNIKEIKGYGWEIEVTKE